jgi:large subunit ribosomal protein L17
MRHRKRRGKLGRTTSHREALLSNMAVSLIKSGRIITTVAKTKALRPFVEKVITLGRRSDISARRQAAALLKDKDAVKKLFSEVGPKFTERNGGYTRIIQLERRVGDGAPTAIIELVS